VIAAALLLGMTPGTTMPAFDGATAWIGTAPIAPEQLRGKVVLVDFWEYTCLNCLRTIPYLKEWYRRYHDDGLEIIGVHTPEFGFSGEEAQVRAAMQRLGITWPVALDDRRALWNRFGVDAWPTEAVFDQQGRLVFTTIGEGDYTEEEGFLQKLLLLGNPHLTMPKPMALLPQDSYDKPGAVCYPHTPEILLAETPVANEPDPQQQSQSHMFGPSNEPYQDRSWHKDGGVYLQGYWSRTKEAVAFQGGDGYFDLPYHAIQVTVVMTSDGKPVRVNVTQNGKPIPPESKGSDLAYDNAGNSYVMVDASRSYDLIMNAKFGKYDLRLSPQGAGLNIYDVAFESCEIPK
jgi:thiol-disulfide isomerase/thioredoxin